MESFELISEKEAFTCPFFSIFERVYRMPDGSENTFYVRHEVDTCCVLAITTDGQFIFEKEFRVGPGEHVLQIPAGRLEGFDDNPDERITEELLEETGYTGNFQKVAALPASPYSERKVHCYLATECKKIAEQQLDPSEFISVELVDEERAKAILMEGKSSSCAPGMLIWQWAEEMGYIS